MLILTLKFKRVMKNIIIFFFFYETGSIIFKVSGGVFILPFLLLLL